MSVPAGKEYAARLAHRRATALELERRHRVVSWSRLVVFLAAGVIAWMSWRAGWISPWWFTGPVLVFGTLMGLHNRVLAARDRAWRAVRFYERCLERLDHLWMGKGRTGRRFVDEDHPYASELDLFGEGTLFELLCTARTAAGEETLASWLKTAAEPDSVKARQEAVEELRAALDLREDLAILGADVKTGIHPEALVHWCEAAPALPFPRLRVAAMVLTAGVVAVVSAYLAGWIPGTVVVPFLGVQVLGAGLLRRRVLGVVGSIQRPARELALLASVLARLEQERFTSPRLRELQDSLDSGGRPPSARVRNLTLLVNALDWRRNIFFVPVAYVLMWATHIGFAIEHWRAVVGPSVARWLQVVGEMEALCALAGYAYENPEDPFPEIVEGEACFEGEGLGHPLIPAQTCIRNDVALDNRQRLLVVSGSNMSGKTTFLRTVGINTVLALAGAPVRARRLRLSVLAVGASIRLQDSIQAGHSRFYAEILRIRQLVDLATGPRTLLFLLDEILHGTNSHDRRIGADAIVRGLLARRALGLITTHDLALAAITDGGEIAAANVHFEDHLENGRMSFDYRMRPGVVKKSNALELMRSIGLEV